MYKDNINLNLYKDFYAVSKCGSLAKAAEQTYSSAPAISKSIKKLEQELNRQLFYRKPNGMELTNYGKKLLYYVEQSFNNLNMAQRSMIEEDNLQKGNLRIGMPSNVSTFFLFDKIIDFHDKYENIDISIITGSTSKLIELLNSHEVDFVIDTSPININEDKNITIKELAEVKYAFIVNKDNMIKINSINDLNDKQLILPVKNTANRNDIDILFKKYNINPINILNLHTSEMIISAVKKDLGIGYVIENLVENEKDIKVLPVNEKLPTVKINIVYDKRYLTVIPKKFINNYIDSSLNF